MAIEKVGNVVLDIESLKPSSDKRCGGSKFLARKGSYRLEKLGMEEQETEKLFIKVLPLQLDQMKPPLIQSKSLITMPSVLNSPIAADSVEGRNKRLQSWATIHPRKILLFFATMSSIGTMTLIYFTIAINRRGGV